MVTGGRDDQQSRDPAPEQLLYDTRLAAGVPVRRGDQDRLAVV
jgi:hypothetical protein